MCQDNVSERLSHEVFAIRFFLAFIGAWLCTAVSVSAGQVCVVCGAGRCLRPVGDAQRCSAPPDSLTYLQTTKGTFD